MKKIGILTFHDADNLGAVLQAYALQNVLQSECKVNADIVDYQCRAIEETKHAKFEKKLSSMIKALLKEVYYDIKHKGFENFRKRNLKMSNKRYDRVTVSEANSVYDAFISGSDQVWNPGCAGRDDTYFLDFADAGKKYSYAASLGSHKFSPDEYKHYSNLLSAMNSISVREKSAIAELEKLGISSASVNADPVFLLSEERWQSIMTKRLYKGRYVLVYLIQPDVNVMNCAREYARKHNCKIISNKKSIEFILHNSPAEFLSWIYYSDCIFTNSFHGTAFSLIFNKPLMADIALRNGGINNRVLEILETTGATQCIIQDSMTARKPDADQEIEILRNEGVHYLRELCIGI